MSEPAPCEPMRLLLINPNTSAHITARMAASARSILPSGVELVALTASEGPTAVRSQSEVSVATRNVISMAYQHGAEYDAILIGISLDCGVDVVRGHFTPRPVEGMTEAACRMASTNGSKFGLLTLGNSMASLYEALVDDLGLSQNLVGVAAPDMPFAFDAAAETVSGDLLDQLVREAKALVEQGAESVVLAGAVLCGYGPALERRLGRPVWDGAVCAAQRAYGKLIPSGHR